jgi:DNA-binding MarR family transcriptional regulator
MKLLSPLLRELGSLSRSIQSLMEVRFRQYRLQRGQFVFLTRITENPGIRQIELTRLCRVDKGTTAKAVRKLLEAGYIQRQLDKEDKRAWNLFPTPAGKAMYEAMLAEENRQLSVCLQGLSPQEQSDFLTVLRKLNKNIERNWMAHCQ